MSYFPVTSEEEFRDNLAKGFVGINVFLGIGLLLGSNIITDQPWGLVVGILGLSLWILSLVRYNFCVYNNNHKVSLVKYDTAYGTIEVQKKQTYIPAGSVPGDEDGPGYSYPESFVTMFYITIQFQSPKTGKQRRLRPMLYPEGASSSEKSFQDSEAEADKRYLNSHGPKTGDKATLRKPQPSIYSFIWLSWWVIESWEESTTGTIHEIKWEPKPNSKGLNKLSKYRTWT